MRDLVGPMVGIFVHLANKIELLGGCVVDRWEVVDVHVLVDIVATHLFVGEG